MKAIIASAHPDDAETAAGGFIAKSVKAGHEVIILHGGPAVHGLEYKGRLSWDVRREESEAAAAILGAQLVFFDWGHGEFEFNKQSMAQMEDLFIREKPDLVVAHWPIDTHCDHQVMGALAQNLFVRQRQWQLAFFEVYAGIQTLEFEPNRYLDITEVVDQKHQAIWVDLFIPDETAAGEYTGRIRISADQLARPVELALELTVLPIALPDEIHWTVELNRYSSPLRWMDMDPDEDPERGRRILHDFYRLAQEHRLTLVALPYTHSGNVQDGREYLPETAGEGTDRRISDWRGFDRWIGPLLDGSAFSVEQGYVGPRRGRPITHMFLPFHEAWPMPIDRHTYNDWADVNTREEFAEWAKTSRRPHEAFTEAYKEGYRKAVQQYFQHLDQQGYIETQHFFFFNNKYYYKVGFFGGMGTRGASFWLLDEPVDYDDYDMNRFLFGLSKQGAAGSRARARFRVDISQPDMNRGLWDDLVDVWMLGGRSRFATAGALRRTMIPGEEYWSYGGGSAVSAPLMNNLTHALYLWCLGDTGYMPWWNCFGGRGNEAWQIGNTLALYYRGQDYPGATEVYSGPLPSVRMKAVRRAQQDIEYLHLIAASSEWTRGRVRQALREYADDPEAPHLSFEHLTLDRIHQLRRAVVHEILRHTGTVSV